MIVSFTPLKNRSPYTAECTESCLQQGIEVIGGDSKEYMNDILPNHMLSKMKKGESSVICAPTGCGKTTAIINQIINLPKSIRILYLVNRSLLEAQIRISLLEHKGYDARNWPMEAIFNADLENITVTTYQSEAKSGSLSNHYDVIIMDEIHYVMCDALFSFDSNSFFENLHNQLHSSKRLYISATPNEVFPIILNMERQHLKTCYTMNADYSHYCFRYYNYNDIDVLTAALKDRIDHNEKAMVFVRNIERGEAISEKLKDCPLIFAEMENRESIEEIGKLEHFSAAAIVTTKILDNGISINDTEVQHIVIEEIDPILWKQMLGRIRTSRKKPTQLTIWMPDYTIQQLHQMLHYYSDQLRILQELKKDIVTFMERPERLKPWMLQTMNGKLQVNTLAIRKLQNMKDHISCMIEDETEHPHAHIRFIRNILQLDELSESDFLNYDAMEDFKIKVQNAFAVFQSSARLEQDRKLLETVLIDIIVHTDVYPKRITGNAIQLKSINAILEFAGITQRIEDLGKTYAVIGGNENEQ